MSTDFNSLPQIGQKVLNQRVSPIAPHSGLSDTSSPVGTYYSHNFVDDTSFTSQDSQSPDFQSKTVSAKSFLSKKIGVLQKHSSNSSKFSEMSFETTSFADFTDINSSRTEDSFFDTSTDSLYASPKWNYKRGLEQHISDSATPLSSKRLLPYANMSKNSHLLNQDHLLSDINKQFPLPSKSDIVPTYQTETAAARVSPNIHNSDKHTQKNIVNKAVENQPNLIDLDSPEKTLSQGNNKVQSIPNNLIDHDISISSREHSYSPEVSPSLTRMSTNKIQKSATRTTYPINESNSSHVINQSQTIMTSQSERAQLNASNLDTEKITSNSIEPIEDSNEKIVSTTPVNDPPPELVNKPFWIPSSSTKSKNKGLETLSETNNNNDKSQPTTANTEPTSSKPKPISSAGHTPYKPIRRKTSNDSIITDIPSIGVLSDDESTPEPPELLTTIIVSDPENNTEESDGLNEPELSFETKQSLNRSGGERNRSTTLNDSVTNKFLNGTLDTSFAHSKHQSEDADSSQYQKEDYYNNSYAPYSFIPNTVHDSRFLQVDNLAPQSMERDRVNYSFNIVNKNDNAHDTTFNHSLANTFNNSPALNSQYSHFPVTTTFNNRNMYYDQEEPPITLINSVPPKRRTVDNNPLGKPPGRRSLVPIETAIQETHDDDDNYDDFEIDSPSVPQGSVRRRKRRSPFSHLNSYHTYIMTSEQDIFKKPQDNEETPNESINDKARENEYERDMGEQEEDSIRSEGENNNYSDNDDNENGEAEDNGSEKPSDQEQDGTSNNSDNSDNSENETDENEMEDKSDEQSEEDEEEVAEKQPQEDKEEIEELIQQKREKEKIVQQEELDENLANHEENSVQRNSNITRSSSQSGTSLKNKQTFERRKSVRQIMLSNKKVGSPTIDVEESLKATEPVRTAKSIKPATLQNKTTELKRKRKSSISEVPKQKILKQHSSASEQEDTHKNKEPRISKSSVSKPKNVWTEEQWKRLAEMVSMYDPPLNYEEPETSSEPSDSIGQIKKTFSQFWNQSKRLFSGKKDFRNSRFITISIERPPSKNSNSPISNYLQSHPNLPLPRVPVDILLEFPSTPPLELSKRIASLYAQGIV